MIFQVVKIVGRMQILLKVCSYFQITNERGADERERVGVYQLIHVLKSVEVIGRFICRFKLGVQMNRVLLFTSTFFFESLSEEEKKLMREGCSWDRCCNMQCNHQWRENQSSLHRYTRSSRVEERRRRRRIPKNGGRRIFDDSTPSPSPPFICSHIHPLDLTLSKPRPLVPSLLVRIPPRRISPWCCKEQFT